MLTQKHRIPEIIRLEHQLKLGCTHMWLFMITSHEEKTDYKNSDYNLSYFYIMNKYYIFIYSYFYFATFIIAYYRPIAIQIGPKVDGHSH